MPSAIVVDLAPAGGRHGMRGIGRYVRGMAAALTAVPDDLLERIWVVGEPGPTIEPFGANAIALGAGTFGGRAPDVARRWIAAREAVRRSRARAMHATDPQRPWIDARAMPVVTVYDLIPMRESEMLRSWRADHRMLYRRYLHQIVTAARVVAISEATAIEVNERLNVPLDRIDIVYPLVMSSPTHVAAQQSDPSQPTFLVVGGLEQHKQPELALRAFAIVRRRFESRLRFVGPGDADQQHGLRKLATELGLGDSVLVEGRVSDEQLEDAYRTATALVSTSRVEGFGLPPVEALIRGTPAVVVDGAAARETLSGVGMIVAADPEAIAAAMLNPRAPTPEAIAEMRTRFGITRMAGSLEALYRRLID